MGKQSGAAAARLISRMVQAERCDASLWAEGERRAGANQTGEIFID